MDELSGVWGINENIGTGEICLRAAVMFIISLVLLRISGMRTFSKGNTFDTIIVFLIGGILSRGVVGATPFIPCVAGGLMIVLIHRFFSWFSRYNKRVEKAIKGRDYVIYEGLKYDEEAMKRARVTVDDVTEELRIETHQSSLDGIERIRVERNGEISFVRAPEDSRK